MAFGQAPGPPASARQIAELEELLRRAGFESFREARHPYGLSQRQAGGRFSVDEADELLERLQAAEEVQFAHGGSPDEPPSGPESSPPAARAPAPVRRAAPARAAKPARTLRSLPDDVLADELVRRGWCCIPPPTEPA